MNIDEQHTMPIPVLPARPPDYVLLKRLADRSGVRLLHLYRLSQGQRVLGLDASHLVRIVHVLSTELTGKVEGQA